MTPIQMGELEPKEFPVVVREEMQALWDAEEAAVMQSELSNLLSDEVFLLRDRFKGYVWNRISSSDRLLLGTLFHNYIKTNDIGGVPIEKTSSGQQRYNKLKGRL